MLRVLALVHRISPFHRISPLALFLTLASFAPLAAQGGVDREADHDRDGLSDFHEIHKYLTDPNKSDTDDDGVPDGDWRERREYQYVVRSVVQVMRPVTIEFLCDDYQDARVLDETADYVELEIIHYPFNTVADAIEGDRRWRRKARRMKTWTKPGPTADWTPAMKRKLERSLASAGIDVTKLDDRTLCERAAKWLLEHAKSEDGFTSFITAFDDKGRPYVPDDLRDGAERGKADKNRTLEEQWKREVSARGMFEHGARGSCTSSAIYLNGCLRALGLPTRIVLCIPVIDASDEREQELVRRGITHNAVRKTLMNALSRLKGSWASHTYNEVWIGGRWRRLNYDKLGQNILDGRFFGLMSHVATFVDWADAKMPDTIGRRQKTSPKVDVFGGPNPYSTIALRDEFGVHCKIENPAADIETMTVRRLHWFDADSLPKNIVAGLEPKGRWGLVAEISDIANVDDFRDFLEHADNRVFLTSKRHPTLKIGIDPRCWWYRNGTVHLYVAFGLGDRRDLVEGTDYRFVPRNDAEGYRWTIANGVATVRRQ